MLTLVENSEKSFLTPQKTQAFTLSSFIVLRQKASSLFYKASYSVYKHSAPIYEEEHLDVLSKVRNSQFMVYCVLLRGKGLHNKWLNFFFSDLGWNGRQSACFTILALPIPLHTEEYNPINIKSEV